MKKKLILLAVCIMALVCCLTACSGEADKPAGTNEPVAAATDAPTEAPKATEEPKPTEAPTPTEAPKPTEEPKPTVAPISVDCVISDYSNDLQVSDFVTQGAVIEYNDPNFVTIYSTTAGDTWVSMRLYDERSTRIFADATVYKFYALKYKVSEGTTFCGLPWVNTTDDTNLITPPDKINFEDNPLIADGKWHVLVFDVDKYFPNTVKLSENGDPFDCLRIPGPTDDGEIYVAYNGLFKTMEDLNAWDENFSARYGLAND